MECPGECWKEELEKQELDPLELTGQEILEAVFKDLHNQWSAAWRKYHVDTTSRVLQVKNRSLPVATGLETAIAYARTHARIEPEEFTAWVNREITEAEYFKDQLQQLQTELKKQADARVRPDEIPPKAIVRFLESPFESQRKTKKIFGIFWLRGGGDKPTAKKKSLGGDSAILTVY